jgi:hypothetical protein
METDRASEVARIQPKAWGIGVSGCSSRSARLLPLVEVHLRAFALRLASQLRDPRLEAVLWAELGHGDGCLACSYHGLAYGPGRCRCCRAMGSLAITCTVVAAVFRVPKSALGVKAGHLSDPS